MCTFVDLKGDGSGVKVSCLCMLNFEHVQLEKELSIVFLVGYVNILRPYFFSDAGTFSGLFLQSFFLKLIVPSFQG